MSYQSDNTGLEVDYSVLKAKTALNLTQGEPIVGDGTYKSPSTYVAEVPGFTENFNYVGGSLVYAGTVDIEVKVVSVISVSSVSAGTDITITVGKNSTPVTDFEIENKLTNANDVKEITHQSKFALTNGDTLDFYIKASNNIVMEKAVWLIDKIN